LRGFPTGEGVQRLGGPEPASSEMNGYPKIFNIEMDPGEQLNVAFLFPGTRSGAESRAGVRALGEGASPIRPRRM